MNRKTISLYVFSCVLAITSFFVGCDRKKPTADVAPQGQEILIGEVGSFTGSEATFGVSTHKGIELAIKKINDGGGLGGKKLRILSLDDQSRTEEAATAITKLITQDRVVAILGEVASGKSLAMAPVAQTNKIPMVSPSSTNPEVTKKGDYIFRVCFIDPFQGSVMAQFAFNSLKVKRVAVLTDVKNDYSVGLAKYFVETFQKWGGQIVIHQSYSSGDMDFKAQLTAIRSKNPEAVFVPGYYTDVGLIGRQAKELGMKVPLLGGDGWDSDKLREIGGSALDGGFFSNHYSPDDKSERVQGFIREFQEAYHSVPDSMAAMGYDAAMVLFEAMKKAPDLSGPALRDALSKTTKHPGVTGDITLDADRNAVKSAVVIEVKEGGKFFYKETVQPSPST